HVSYSYSYVTLEDHVFEIACSDSSDQSNNSEDNPLNSTEYKIYKFVTKDDLGNAVKELAEADADFSKFNIQQYLLKVVRGFNGAVAADNIFGDLTKLAVDIWQGWDNAKDIAKYFRSGSKIWSEM